MLVRYGRHADPQHRILHPNPDPQLLSQYPDGVPISEGHYVIIAKNPTGQLTTIDTHASQMHDYDGIISDNFWNVWHNNNGYISIEFIYCYDPNVLAGGTLKRDAVYIVPNKVMKHFVNDLLNLYECVHPRKSKSICISQRRSKSKNRRKSLDATPPPKNATKPTELFSIRHFRYDFIGESHLNQNHFSRFYFRNTIYHFIRKYYFAIIHIGIHLIV